MPMNQLLHKLIGIGQAADNLCRTLPNNHRMQMALRDLANCIAIETVKYNLVKR
jgi:hypothetical protein